ncbi:MAG: MFS transporter [Candidatus Paceibacterota bacterium]
MRRGQKIFQQKNTCDLTSGAMFGHQSKQVSYGRGIQHFPKVLDIPDQHPRAAQRNYFKISIFNNDNSVLTWYTFYMLNSDFRRIIAMNTLAGIGMGLVGIFIPIYLLHLGYSVSIVITWLIVHHVTILLGAFLAVYLSNIIGLVQCWYVRIGLVILLFTGLFLIPTYPNILFIVAFISGMEAAFFWIPYNILTVRKTEENTMGSSLALMTNVGAVFGIIVPLVAALIIITYGYQLLFLFAFFFILVSIIPVLPLRHEKTKFHFNWLHIKQIVKENRHFIVPEILDNLGQDAQVIWTLFLIITSLTVLDIGILGVISGLVGIVVTHITGSLIDKTDKKIVVRFGAVATTIMWTLSYLTAVYMPNPVALYLVTTLRGFALGIFASAYGVMMFNRARSSDAQFIVLREIPTVFGRVIVFMITLIFFASGIFELSFLMIAIISLYFWFNNLDVLMERKVNDNPSFNAID